MKQTAARLWFALFALLCLAAIALSVLRMAAPAAFPRSPERSAAVQTGYLVRDEGGHVAVYVLGEHGEAGNPAAVLEDVYVNLLPEPDVLRLRQGIRVADETQLERLLEDLGA